MVVLLELLQRKRDTSSRFRLVGFADSLNGPQIAAVIRADWVNPIAVEPYPCPRSQTSNL